MFLACFSLFFCFSQVLEIKENFKQWRCSISVNFQARCSTKNHKNHQIRAVNLRKKTIDFQIDLLYYKQTLIIVELKHDKLLVESYYWLQDCNRFHWLSYLWNLLPPKGWGRGCEVASLRPNSCMCKFSNKNTLNIEWEFLQLHLYKHSN